jgi:hypothetical protein
LFAKVSAEEDLVTASGREFHKRGLPCDIDLSPNFAVFDGGGTCSRDRLLDLS